MKTFLSLVITVLAGSLLPACVASGDNTEDNGAESTVDTAGDALITGLETFTNAGGYRLDVDHASTSNDARIVEYHQTGSLQQLWTAKPQGDGTYMIVNYHSGKCIDSDHGGTGNGTAVTQYTCHTNTGPYDSQRWVRVENDALNLHQWKHNAGGRCMDMPGNLFQDNLGVQLWDCNGAGGQNWK